MEKGKVKRPKLEELIPTYLDRGKTEIALGFIECLRANKMPPAYRPSLRFKCDFKGKGICTISLPREWTNGNPYRDNEFAQPWMSQEDTRNNWIVIPSLDRFGEYESRIGEDTKSRILDVRNMYRCNGCWASNPNFPNPRETCGPRPVRAILGREFEGLCGRAFFWFYNPDEATINCIKELLEFETAARVMAIG